MRSNLGYYSEELVRVPAHLLQGVPGTLLGASGEGMVKVELPPDENPPRKGDCVQVTPHSRNGKLGCVCITTYAGQMTCPQKGHDARPCPLMNSGCYAEGGNVGRFQLPTLNASPCTRRQAAEKEARLINALVGRAYEPLRLHTVGDCCTVDGAALVADATQRYMYASGAPAWNYTHAWNVPRGAWGMVSVLRSCHTLEECYDALDACYAPALLVDYYQTRDGKRLVGRAKSGHVIGRCHIGRGLIGIPCPAIWSENDLTCPQCRLCWNDQERRNKHEVIMFAAHGDDEDVARTKGFSPKCRSVGV